MPIKGAKLCPSVYQNSKGKFDMEIENVEQKNNSKCSNLICCRGQVQRPFPCDSLAVCRILVLLMKSNEHR